MKKQNGLTLIETLVSAGMVGIILGGGFYLYTSFGGNDVQNTTTEEDLTAETKTTPETGEQETPAITSEESIDETLQTYRNEKYGFEIRYPDDFEFGGPNPKEKLLFSLSSPSENINYEFWIQELNSKTLEEVFEERLILEDISYFDWIRSQGGEVSSENIGENEWLFIDGSAKFNLSSHYLLSIPEQDVYLIVDIGLPADSDLPIVRDILATLEITR